MKPYGDYAQLLKSSCLVVESWAQLQSDQDRLDLLAAIQQWAMKFRITEEWIMDAALETLLIHGPHNTRQGERSDQWYWRCTPKGFHPSFEPAFDRPFWYPPRGGWPETWDSFRGRMEVQFNSQLTKYRTMVEQKFGFDREDSLRRDAGWTVKYQKGKTAIEIAQEANLSNKYKDPEQTVFRAVKRFAESIGLNLIQRRARYRGISN
jgi:hypothetical protein